MYWAFTKNNGENNLFCKLKLLFTTKVKWIRCAAQKMECHLHLDTQLPGLVICGDLDLKSPEVDGERCDDGGRNRAGQGCEKRGEGQGHSTWEGCRGGI